MLMLFFQSCQKKDLNFQAARVEEDSIEAVKEQFVADSIRFHKSDKKGERNFRQKLERSIHWGSAKKFDDGRYFVPMTLMIRGLDSLFDGRTNVFPHRVKLMVEKTETGYQYTMLTYLEKDPTAKLFTGTLLYEDYFLGNTLAADYVNHKLVPYLPKLGHVWQAVGGYTEVVAGADDGPPCGWYHVATICVGDFNGGSAPDLCNKKYEFICHGGVGSPQLPPGDEYIPLGDGGGGGGEGTEPTYTENAAQPGQDQPAVDPKDLTDCFDNISNVGATYTVTVYVQEPTTGGSGASIGKNFFGHAAIGLTKKGSNGQSITQVLGFYPDASNIFQSFTAPSKIVDNGDSDYLMQYTVKIDYGLGTDGASFQSIIDYINAPPPTYHGFVNNCVTFVLAAAASGGILVPHEVDFITVPLNPLNYNGPQQIIPAFSPNKLGQALRAEKANGDPRISTANNSPVATGKGGC